MGVAEFVAREAHKPFAWGVTDCCSTVDRWVSLNRGVSPIAADGWDGSEAAARACLGQRFALPARVNRAFRVAGFRPTRSPQPGDVGLAVYQGRLCVAIHAGPIWFSRHADGLVGAPLDCIWKAWKL